MATDSHHLRKLAAGTCLTAAPILLLASAVTSPKLDMDGADQLALVSAHADRWFISQVLGLAALALFVPAVMGLIHMLRERQVMAGFIGGGLTLLGAMGAIAATGVSMVMWEMAKPGIDSGAMSALATRLTDSTGLILAIFVPTICIAIGMLVLAFGLFRAHVVPAPSAIALAVGAICLVLGYGALGSIAFVIAGSGFLLVGMMSIGWNVLTESDEAWEHTPQFSGFRPAGGMR
jgi:hypothetical protein